MFAVFAGTHTRNHPAQWAIERQHEEKRLLDSIGIATRKYSGKKRLIFDISSPHSNSFTGINESIPLEPFSFYYASVDDAIKLIKLEGHGTMLAKADITDVFKMMPIHPSKWPL